MSTPDQCNDGSDTRGDQKGRSGSGLRVAIGAALTLYYLWAVVAIARGFPDNLDTRIQVEYVASWWPTWLDISHGALGGVSELWTGANWLSMVALVLGGVAIMVSYRPGMLVALVALGILLASGLVTFPTTVAVAMGWIRIGFEHPPELAEIGAQIRDLPPEAMRTYALTMLGLALFRLGAKAIVFVWLWRYLGRTRISASGAEPSAVGTAKAVDGA